MNRVQCGDLKLIGFLAKLVSFGSEVGSFIGLCGLVFCSGILYYILVVQRVKLEVHFLLPGAYYHSSFTLQGKAISSDMPWGSRG